MTRRFRLILIFAVALAVMPAVAGAQTTYIWANNANSTLAVSIGTGDTTIQVASGDGAKFPSPSVGQAFWITVEQGVKMEIMLCTARASDVFTCTRAQQVTTTQSFTAGASVQNRLTRFDLEFLRDKQPNLVDVGHGGTNADDAAEARDNLGLGIGADVQAYSARLAALAGLSPSADQCAYFTGSTTMSAVSCTSFGRSLWAGVDAPAVRTTLGIDADDAVTFGTVTTPGLTLQSAGPITFASGRTLSWSATNTAISTASVIRANSFNQMPLLTANLIVPNTGSNLSYVTDADDPQPGEVLVGGGSDVAQVYYDTASSQWYVFAVPGVGGGGGPGGDPGSLQFNDSGSLGGFGSVDENDVTLDRAVTAKSAFVFGDEPESITVDFSGGVATGWTEDPTGTFTHDGSGGEDGALVATLTRADSEPLEPGVYVLSYHVASSSGCLIMALGNVGDRWICDGFWEEDQSLYFEVSDWTDGLTFTPEDGNEWNGVLSNITLAWWPRDRHIVFDSNESTFEKSVSMSDDGIVVYLKQLDHRIYYEPNQTDGARPDLTFRADYSDEDYGYSAGVGLLMPYSSGLGIYTDGGLRSAFMVSHAPENTFSWGSARSGDVGIWGYVYSGGWPRMGIGGFDGDGDPNQYNSGASFLIDNSSMDLTPDSDPDGYALSQPALAAGSLGLASKTGDVWFIWFDADGNLRARTTHPPSTDESTWPDDGGVIIGAGANGYTGSGTCTSWVNGFCMAGS